MTSLNGNDEPLSLHQPPKKRWVSNFEEAESDMPPLVYMGSEDEVDVDDSVDSLDPVELSDSLEKSSSPLHFTDSILNGDVAPTVCDEKEWKSLHKMLKKLPNDLAKDYFSYLEKLRRKVAPKPIGTVQSMSMNESNVTKQKKTKPQGRQTLKKLEADSKVQSKSASPRNARYQRRCSMKNVEQEDISSLPRKKLRENLKEKKKCMKTFQCDICETAFQSTQTLNAHAWRIHQIKRFKCLVCDDKFLSKFEMHKHMKSYHSGPSGFECSVCSKSYVTFQSFLAHMNRVHSTNVKLPCIECGLVFKHAWLLRSHSLVHSSQPKFVCSLCKKGMSVKSVFLDHLNVHSGLKPYKCNECHKCFHSQTNYLKHLLLHNSANKYSCVVCSKSYSSLSVLNKHKRVHETTKNFKCEQCGKSFKLPQTLGSHRRFHKKQQILLEHSKSRSSSSNNSTSKKAVKSLKSYDFALSEQSKCLSHLDTKEVNKEPINFDRSLLSFYQYSPEKESDDE